MILAENLEVQLYFDGFQYPLDTGSISIKIVETATECLPMVEMAIADNSTMDGAPSIADGTKVKLVIRDPREGDPLTMNFRVFSYLCDAGDTSENIYVSGYLDFPDLFKNSKFKHYELKTSDVAAKIASENGLQFEGDGTSDSQTWLRSGITGAAFLKHLADHAYANELSCFVATVTRQGVLRYYNLDSRRKSKSTWSFVQKNSADAEPKSTEISFHDASYDSRSGFFNKWRGYGFFASEYSVLTAKNTQVYADKASKSTDHLSVNTELAEASRYIAAPLNCGNTHENFFKANIQNSRNLALFSTSLTVSTSILKNVSLLDRVLVTFDNDSENTLKQPMSGDYFVSKIVTEIGTGGVKVHYNLVREGFNSSDPKTGKELG